MQFCIKKRTDEPANIGSTLHIKKAKNLFESTERFQKAVDRNFM
jgi:hypothetical protein